MMDVNTHPSPKKLKRAGTMPALFVTSLIIRSGCNKNERGTYDENIIVPVFDLSCSGGD